MATRRILVVCSTGGHFDAAVAVLPAFAGWHVEMVSYRDFEELGRFDPAEFGIRKVHRISQFGTQIGFRLAISFLLNFAEALVVLLRSRPDTLFSTGAEISLPVAFVARCLGIRVVHLETATRPKGLSLSGRLMLPLSHTFFVQWPEAQALAGGKARFAGRIF